MRYRLQIAATFLAVGLGALTVTLLHDPKALVPQPPYGPWIIPRAFALGALGCLGLLLVMDVGDDPWDLDEVDSSDHPIHWGAVALAFLVSALACVTFIAASALTDCLDRLMG